MVSYSQPKFYVRLLTPKSLVLDGRAGSVVLPGKDGYFGVLRGHCPMLAALTEGIVEVRQMTDRPDAFFIIDGGFAQVAENYLTILADDVLTFEGLDQKAIDHLVNQAANTLAGQEYARLHGGVMARRKAALTLRMAQLAGVNQTAG